MGQMEAKRLGRVQEDAGGDVVAQADEVRSSGVECAGCSVGGGFAPDEVDKSSQNRFCASTGQFSEAGGLGSASWQFWGEVESKISAVQLDIFLQKSAHSVENGLSRSEKVAT
jgi:hypothetical protein